MRGESGAALLEFAIVFSLFVFVLYGLIAFGMMLALKQSVTAAAAEGARSAVGVTDDAAAVTTAKAAVLDRLDWLAADKKAAVSAQLDANPPTVVSPCPGSPLPTSRCIRVEVTYPYAGNELVPPAPGLGLVTPSSFGSTAVVQITS